MGIRFTEGLSGGRVHVQQIDPAELSPGEFAYRVRHSVEVDDAKVVVIDSLNGYLNAMPEERFLTIQLHELLTYLGRRGVTTLLVVAQHGLMGNAHAEPRWTPATWPTRSCCCGTSRSTGKVKKAISVVKKRSGAHEESIRELRFDAKGIHLSEPLTHLRGILTGVPVPAGEAGKADADQTTVADSDGDIE